MGWVEKKKKNTNNVSAKGKGGGGEEELTINPRGLTPATELEKARNINQASHFEKERKDTYQ